MTLKRMLVSAWGSRIIGLMSDISYEFEYRLSEGERAASHLIASQVVVGVLGPWAVAIALFVCVATSVTLGLLLIDEPGVGVAELSVKFVLIGSTTALVFHYVLNYFSSAVIQKRQHGATGDQLTRIKIDREGITVRRGKNMNAMSWQDVLEVSDKHDWIVLASAPTAYVLPRRLFEEEADRQQALSHSSAWHAAARTAGPRK